MTNGATEVQLPESIGLTLGEASEVLEALDYAEVLATPDSTTFRLIRAAIRLLTRKLWPELGHLLDEDEE